MQATVHHLRRHPTAAHAERLRAEADARYQEWQRAQRDRVWGLIAGLGLIVAASVIVAAVLVADGVLR